MRFLFLNFRQQSPKRKNSRRFNIERLLFLTCICTFLLMILVQAALTSPAVRTFLNGGYELEGTPLGVEEYLYKEGELGLKLLDSDGNSDIGILVNGDVADVFDSSEKSVTVKDGDVIEVDGSEIEGFVDVEIVSKSDNVKNDCLSKKFRIKGNIKALLKVRVE